jgi:hypothetical protein
VRPVEYSPDDFDALLATAESLRVPSLCHRPFVDHYYASNPWSRLYLVRSGSGAIVGVLGIDQMRFALGGEHRTLAFATNYHAAQPGVGGLLYLHWLKTCPLGLVFGGSEDTHRILRRQRWTYFPGVKTYSLNRRYHAAPEEPTWRRWAKKVLGGLPRKSVAARARQIPHAVRQRISLCEEVRVSEDMLPATSPFALRFAPPADYLNWRYRTDLSFVRYRVFRVATEGRTSGYVILNESPDRVVVAQCDGESASDLAHAVLLSLAEATAQDASTREVSLACSHPEMGEVYRRFGFRVGDSERPLAVGSRAGPVDLPADSSRWNVNFDWGDNGLRAPFLDQRPGAEDRLTSARRIGQDAPA